MKILYLVITNEKEIEKPDTELSDEERVKKIKDERKTRDIKLAIERKNCYESVKAERQNFEKELSKENDEYKKRINTESEKIEVARGALESCNKTKKEEYYELHALFEIALDKWHVFYISEVRRSVEKEKLLKRIFEENVLKIEKDSETRIKIIMKLSEEEILKIEDSLEMSYENFCKLYKFV
ncbi:uncharacterized protein VNE69_09054 [Vairimorpha necatrix]|uniref:Uncharacterized protein n=1 Tax=Vairimorpha necatrix TaxID=6039 RepID=A0AAX4JER3_9MICR